MKLKIGNRLNAIRAEKNLSQLEMSEVLGISASAYSRLERGETSIEFEDLVRFATALDIDVQDLLPETLRINNHNNSNQSGLIFGNIYNYYSANEQSLGLQSRLESLEYENRNLKEELLRLKTISKAN
jgi:transcriptional regulator with XRE-family HTH domain